MASILIEHIWGLYCNSVVITFIALRGFIAAQLHNVLLKILSCSLLRESLWDFDSLLFKTGLCGASAGSRVGHWCSTCCITELMCVYNRIGIWQGGFR